MASIRNVAIIAHVDHGKTTLVDTMFQQSGMFRDNQAVEERLLDSMDLERERGITIAAKNCAVHWKGTKINIIDTPGHADFGGEVERGLSMADGVLLLVDAAEGPLPQTRFVLSKALDAGLTFIVVINKIDRPDARAHEVHDEVLELLMELGADDAQLDFPYFYAAGRDGIAKRELDEESDNIHCLLDAVVEHLPAPKGDISAPLRMLVSDLGYSDYLGRLAIGRIADGVITVNDPLVCIGADGTPRPLKAATLQVYDGTSLVRVDAANAGDIVILSGIENVNIGDTIGVPGCTEALPRITVDEPTVSMRFRQNDSPLAGREGSIVQTAKISERLEKETLRNVAIQVEMAEENDCFIVKGRGELQLAVLIETMRREGFEITVGRPEVIYHYENGEKLEPIENLTVDCEEAHLGIVMEKLSRRKAKTVDIQHHLDSGRVKVLFDAPARALIGYRDEFLTDTRGSGIMHAIFSGYEPYRGDFASRHTGSIISDRAGHAVAYAIFNLEPRGRIFVRPGDPVYEGMVVGEHAKEDDITANPARQKKLTNMRASGKDDNVQLTPVPPLSLEFALQFIRPDEMVEITPRSIRMRKAVLSAVDRKQKKAV